MYKQKFSKLDFLSKIRSLTGCLVSVGPSSDVVLLVACLGSCYLLQLSDFRHAKLRIEVEEHAPSLDCQVVL